MRKLSHVGPWDHGPSASSCLTFTASCPSNFSIQEFWSVSLLMLLKVIIFSCAKAYFVMAQLKYMNMETHMNLTLLANYYILCEIGGLNRRQEGKSPWSM